MNKIINNKIACFIPIKKNSKRIKGKNFKKIKGKEIFKIGIDLIVDSNLFEDVYIDTDSEEIKSYALQQGAKVISRLPELTSDSTNGNHLLEHWIKLYPQYDYYYQYHVTSPLTNSTTISECVKILINKTEYDSILTVEEVYSWFWYGNCPINYDPKKLPRSQDATPVIKETTALYGISKIAFKETNCRIGRNPYFYVVDQKQAVDIDNPLDLVVVKALASEK